MRRKRKKRPQFIYPPSDGWKRLSLYLVDVSMNMFNPVFRAALFTGYITDGKPCGYHQIIHWASDPFEIKDVYYLKAVRLLAEKDDFAHLGVMPNEEIYGVIEGE